MTVPEVVRFPDGHFRKVIYGLGPYIADYPEQALLACIVQGWCPRWVYVYAGTKCISDNSLHCRCTTPADDLDSGHHVRRSQVHTELIVEEFELGTLWDEYGLVGDIVVRILSHFSCMCISDCYLFSHSQTVSLEPISTNFCLPISFINSSREPSKTTSLHG